MAHHRLDDQQQDKRGQRKDQPVDAAGAETGHSRFALACKANAAIRPPADRKTQKDRAHFEPAVARAKRLLNELEIERRQHGLHLIRPIPL